MIELLAILLVFITPTLASAYDVNEKLSIEGTLTGVYQDGDLDAEERGEAGADREAAVFDLGANFHPTDSDEFQVTFSFAAGNGLNTTNFSLAPYADDLEDDLKDINGRDRDYLLEAWYKHKFTFTKNVSLGATFGIIDSTAYIDDNAFANDEVAQFMNAIFVNNTLANLPSYDIGVVLELDISNFSLRGLVMEVGIGDEDEDKTRFYALSFSSLLLPTLDMNYGVTRSDTYEADVKTNTSYNYNMFLTALIFPDLTSNLDLAYITDRDEETDDTSQDFNSTLKFTARLNPAMTVDLTERYNTSNAEESTWTAASLIGVSWRPSDILSMQVGAGQEWQSDESSDFTNYLTVTIAPTYKTQLNVSYSHSQSSDDYSASYNWTINRIFSMHAYCTYIDEDETEFAYGGQFVIRY